MKHIGRIVLFVSFLFLLLGCKENSYRAKSSVVETQSPISIDDPSEASTNTEDEQVSTLEENQESEEVLAVPLVKKSMGLEEIATEWYIRIVVEDVSNHMRNDNAQLGALKDENATVAYALKAITPFGSRYLDVVFKNPEDLEEGAYKSLFYPSTTEEMRWQFTIKSFDNNAHMIVSWRGLYILTPYVDEMNRRRYKEYRSMQNGLLDEMHLVDLSTGEEIAVRSHGNVNAIEVAMDGEYERTLEWRVYAHTNSTLVEYKRVVDSKSARSVKELTAVATTVYAKEKVVVTTESLVPPTFEVLVK